MTGSGPLFRRIDRHGHIGAGRLSDKAVALILKRAARAAGFDAAELGGHSLRAGLATALEGRGRGFAGGVLSLALMWIHRPHAD